MTPAVSESGMTPAPAIIYPDCDGKPMSDNTKQFRWITLLYTNFRELFADHEDVFVAGDLLWYPMEGENEERLAPDSMVVFGRPKGDRGSYKQWEENDVPVTVAFEILSPSNDSEEMADKLLFYEHHGVEEYYVYDPEANKLEIYRRGRAALVRVRDIASYRSGRLGIRFEMTEPEMTVFKPDGERFLYFEERQADRRRQQRAKEATDRADEATLRADEEKRRAEEATRLRRRQTELSRKVRQGQATTEEQAELDRLESESS